MGQIPNFKTWNPYKGLIQGYQLKSDRAQPRGQAQRSFYKGLFYPLIQQRKWWNFQECFTPLETSEFIELNGNFEKLNFTLEMVEIRGQKRAVLRPRAFGGSLKEQRLTGIFGHCAEDVFIIMAFMRLQMTFTFELLLHKKRDKGIMTNSTLFVQQRTRSKKLVYFLLITRAKNGSSYVVEQHVPRSKLAKNAKNAFFLITNYESFLSKDSQKYNNFFLI